MPRRPPPSPLRLITGPLPLRNRPKHTLPSLPRPAFYPRAPVESSNIARARARSIDLSLSSPFASICMEQMAEAVQSTDDLRRASFDSTGSRRSSSFESGGSNSGASSPVSAKSTMSVIRGPWDHSGSIRVPFDVEAVLAPPQRAVVNVALAR